MKIFLTNNQGYKWFTFKSISTKGYAWVGEKYLSGMDLSEYISSTKNLEQIVKELNGCYACVIDGKKNKTAFVDRTRSFPLFYSEEKEQYILTDDANLLRRNLSNPKKDEKSIKEFIQTGYVTGNNTLIREVKQLQAGELIEFNLSKRELKKLRYFEFRHRDYLPDIETELLNKLDQSHLSVFKRLISSLNGRTAVVPLSGGYDSRLIVLMLKRLGYENVLCFTYGTLGNTESIISKKTAEALEYEWHFVPYSKSKWDNWYSSKDYKNYEKWASNLTSLALLQDWPAVQYLKNNNIIPNDSVFIPGHAGDFVAGSHIPKIFINEGKYSFDQIKNEIFNNHYKLWRQKLIWLNTEFAHSFIADSPKVQYSNEEAADEFEKWDWQERQSKFIVNSVRVYEYFGYEWLLPLWDKDILDFWARIPIAYRYERRLYKKYDEELLSKKIMDKFHLPSIKKESKGNAYKKIKQLLFGRGDNLAFSGGKGSFIPIKIKRRIKGEENINSTLVKKFIENKAWF